MLICNHSLVCLQSGITKWRLAPTWTSEVTKERIPFSSTTASPRRPWMRIKSVSQSVKVNMYRRGNIKKKTYCVLVLCIGHLYSCKKPQGEYSVTCPMATELSVRAMDLWCVCVWSFVSHVCMRTLQVDSLDQDLSGHLGCIDSARASGQ